jgi:hypothetical protein
MARARRTCSDRSNGDTCPALAGPDGRCAAHARSFEDERGSRQRRGYDRAFDAARRQAEKDVQDGRAVCWRCGLPIRAGDPWDLGHDGPLVAGPEHRSGCNRRAAGLKTHGKAWTPKRPLP